MRFSAEVEYTTAALYPANWAFKTYSNYTVHKYGCHNFSVTTDAISYDNTGIYADIFKSNDVKN